MTADGKKNPGMKLSVCRCAAAVSYRKSPVHSGGIDGTVEEQLRCHNLMLHTVLFSS